jgi:hypothetical protein
MFEPGSLSIILAFAVLAVILGTCVVITIAIAKADKASLSRMTGPRLGKAQAERIAARQREFAEAYAAALQAKNGKADPNTVETEPTTDDAA